MYLYKLSPLYNSMPKKSNIMYVFTKWSKNLDVDQ